MAGIAGYKQSAWSLRGLANWKLGASRRRASRRRASRRGDNELGVFQIGDYFGLPEPANRKLGASRRRASRRRASRRGGNELGGEAVPSRGNGQIGNTPVGVEGGRGEDFEEDESPEDVAETGGEAAGKEGGEGDEEGEGCDLPAGGDDPGEPDDGEILQGTHGFCLSLPDSGFGRGSPGMGFSPDAVFFSSNS